MEGNDLNESIDRLTRMSSSLFTFPTFKRTLFALMLSSLFLWPLSALLSTYYDAISSLAYGASLLCLIVSSDAILRKAILASDPIYDFRRCLVLSLISSSAWLLLSFLGWALETVLNWRVWVKTFLLGFCASAALRLVAFFTTSSIGRAKAALSALLQPILFLILSSAWLSLNELSVIAFRFALAAIPTLTLGALAFVRTVDAVGRRSAFEMPSTSLLKAFLASWAEGLNDPIEGILEDHGEESDVYTSILTFRRADGRVKAMIVIPSFHPGPFKDVGSSSIPFMIQSAIEREYGCLASVLHGLSGHDMDLTSRRQSERVVKAILEPLSPSPLGSMASPRAQSKVGEASAGSQIFGSCAFITLTLAPKTTEDLSKEVGEKILVKAKERGLQDVMIVNAHNSIEGPLNSEGAIDDLVEAAVKSLDAALGLELKPVRVGAAKEILREYGVREGIGPGGIVVIVVEVGDQKVAYVTIDGNNMVPGLRDKILKALSEVNIDCGEVMTTDTHIVNGVVRAPRGYRPLGEVVDHNLLIGYVKRATLNALDNLELVEVEHGTAEIGGVKVVGAKQIEELSSIIERTVKRAKIAALTIFSAVSAASIVLLSAL